MTTTPRPHERRPATLDGIERAWRDHSIETGCRVTEDLVADKRTKIVAYQTLAFIGFFVNSFAAFGAFGNSPTVRLVLIGLGSVAIAVGFEAKGRRDGQRQVAGWWRESLERPMPTDETDHASTTRERDA